MTFKKGTRPLLWECFVTVLLSSPVTQSETVRYQHGPCLLGLWIWSVSALALDLHVSRILPLWLEAKNTFLDLPKAPTVCSCIIVMCKVLACLWLWFLLVLERIFLSQALGRWYVPGRLARRQRQLWGQHVACLISHRKLALLCVLLFVESSPPIQAAYTLLSLNGLFHNTWGMHVFFSSKSIAILMVCVCICASLKIMPHLIL